MNTLDLNGTWDLRPVENFRGGFYPREEGWVTLAVPSHWQEHPSLQHHSGKVVYRRHFSADPQPGRRYWLRLEGAFYWSQAFLNGQSLGCHEGYFAPQEHEVTTLLDRENLLVVEVDCPDEHQKVHKRLITGVFSHWDCIDPETNPGGIWLPVSLLETGPVRLSLPRLHTETIGERQATIRWAVEAHAAQATEAQLEWTIRPHTFAGEVQTFVEPCHLKPGTQELHGTLLLRDAELWWTHDLGQPSLYEITARILIHGQPSDQQRFRFGVRTFELRNWIAHLNGKPLLIKGNNYAPGDTRIARMTLAAYVRDLRLVTEAHMNLLRVHAHIEHPAFYDAADQAGLLLWQDFPLQWHYRRDVFEPAHHQARAMVHLLGNHPSVAIWCMHNEPVYLADTKDERLFSVARTIASAVGPNWNRSVLDGSLQQLVRSIDPSRPAIRSSGEYHVPGRFGGGDGHYYFGWYLSYGSKRRFDELRRRFPRNIRFVTEFGAQSFPNYESCARFMPTDIEQLDVAQLTDRHHFQPEVMGNWYDWRAFTTLDELITYSQEYQSEINRYYIDRLRYHKYRPTGGIVAFLFNDSNPAVQWSVVDYWRVPKRSYAALQLAFSPRYIFALLDHDHYILGQVVEVPIYVVNDLHEPVAEWPVTIRLSNDQGLAVATVQHLVSLPADSLAELVERLRFKPVEAGTYCLDLAFGDAPAGMHQSYTIVVMPTNGIP